MSDFCERIETELSDDEALVVIQPYFDEMVEVFTDHGFPEVEEVRFDVDMDMNSTPRHFAGCYLTGDRISVSPDMADLPRETIMGILAHELGHAVDFLNPAVFYFGKNGLTERDREKISDKQWRRFLKAWKTRDDDTIEFIADAIAELATGTRIGYAGPCVLQCFGCGGSRPRGLR